MYCKNCGNKINEGNFYCTNCGMKQDSMTTNQSNRKNTSLILGIISCFFLFIPMISIPCAIISIILGKKYQKETKEKCPGSILGMISLILTILLFIVIAIFLFIFVMIMDNDTTSTDNIYYKYENSIEEEYFDLTGYSWIGDDKSVLYLKKDKSYSWYQDDSNQEDNYYIGTYLIYNGEEAIKYITNNLTEYGITEEEQRNYFQNSTYSINDYYLIILDCSKANINGQEITNTTKIYYYGFLNEFQKKLEVTNMDTQNKGTFTLKEKLSNIDI